MKEIFNGIIEFDLLDDGWKPGLPGGKPPRKISDLQSICDLPVNSAGKLALALAG